MDLEGNLGSVEVMAFLGAIIDPIKDSSQSPWIGFLYETKVTPCCLLNGITHHQFFFLQLACDWLIQEDICKSRHDFHIFS